MEITEQLIPESLKHKTSSELILEKSRFAGNFGDPSKEKDLSKDIFMVDLETIQDYLRPLDQLPQGFGYTGGVARGALLDYSETNHLNLEMLMSKE